MNEKIKIYKVTDRYEPNDPMYFKGIEDLREFGKDRLYNGWETDVKEEDLNDNNILFDFLQNDYGVDIEVLIEVSIDDFKTN